MPSNYIDEDYYLNEYKGTPPDPPEDLPKYITRASMVIDMVTRYRIVQIGFDNLQPFQQDLVKQATAAQVEYFVISGGLEEVINGEDAAMRSVTIGKFSYGGGRNSSVSQSTTDLSEIIAPILLQLLAPTGLLYMGVPVHGC